MGETKPPRLSYVPSIVYSDFRADFREVRADQQLSIFPIWGRGPADPNKPNIAKAISVNGMIDKSPEQTQRDYHTSYQPFAAILAPIFRKFGWKRRGSLSGIRAHGGRVGRRGFQWRRGRVGGALIRWATGGRHAGQGRDLPIVFSHLFSNRRAQAPEEEPSLGSTPPVSPAGFVGERCVRQNRQAAALRWPSFDDPRWCT